MIGVLVGQQLKMPESDGKPADLAKAFAGLLPLRTVCVGCGISREAEADSFRVNDIWLNLASGIQGAATNQAHIAALIVLGALARRDPR